MFFVMLTPKFNPWEKNITNIYQMDIMYFRASCFFFLKIGITPLSIYLF